jgi:hypothetical protein
MDRPENDSSPPPASPDADAPDTIDDDAWTPLPSLRRMRGGGSLFKRPLHETSDADHSDEAPDP